MTQMLAEPTYKTYAARRRIKVRPDHWREPGELLPEAVTFFRLDSWLHTGQIVEKQVTEAELRDAIAQYCPDDEERILSLSGVTSDLVGPHSTPRVPGGMPAYRPWMQQWALGLEGVLVGPVPHAPRNVPVKRAAHDPVRDAESPRVLAARKAAATRAANKAAKQGK